MDKPITLAIISGVGIGLLGGLLFGAWYYIAFVIRLLADRNILFSYPLETTAKVFMRNGRVRKLVMAYKGRCFAGELDRYLPEPQKWDVVDGNVQVGSRLPFIKGIRWVGLPPFSNVYNYRFSWASLEEQQSDQDLAKKPVSSDKVIDYIFLRSDVYVSKLEKAECANNIPLDSILLVGGKIVNPYKALFSIERWLEASLNIVNSRMRSFFGGKSYVELRDIKEAMRAGTGTGATHELSSYFHEVMGEIKDKYGFEITFVQIYSIDPGSDLADEFIRATTQVYVAEQKRDANIAEGVGLAARDKAHFKAISEIPGGVDIFKWDAVQRSNLTTFVDGGNVGVSIPIGGNTTRPAPAAPAATPAAETTPR